MAEKKKKRVVTKRRSTKDQTEEDEASFLSRNPYLKEILEIDETGKKFLCKLCTQNQPKIQGKISNPVGGQIYWLKRHLETQKHQAYTHSNDRNKLADAILSLDSLKKSQSIVPKDQEVEDTEANEEVQSFENEEDLPLSRNQEANLYFEIAQFIINRHLPFDSAPSILEFCREIALNYEVQLLERSHLSALTLTKIIRECIGDTLRSRIIQDLCQGPFALLIDASSDIYGGKYLGVLAVMKKT